MYQRAGESAGKLWAKSAGEERVDGFVFHVWSVVGRPKVALEAIVDLPAEWRGYERQQG